MHAALSTLIVGATDAASSAHDNPLVVEPSELVWGLVSFLILFAILAKVAFPSLQRVLKERSESIEGKLAHAEQERVEAQRLLEEYRQQLDDAHAESRRIIDQARQNADRLESELRAKAEEQAARIVDRAKETIRVERDQALQTLRSEVGGLAVDLASRVVGESLDRDRHVRLVDQYIRELDAK